MSMTKTTDPAVFEVTEFDQVVIVTESGSTNATVEIGIRVQPEALGGTSTIEYRSVSGTITDSDHGRLIDTPCNVIRVSGHTAGNEVTVHGRRRGV